VDDVEVLVAVEAIKRVKARYFRLIDTKLWDEIGSLFVDGAAVDFTSVGGPVVHGGDEITSFLREALGDVVTVHCGHTPEIELTSPTTAVGIWALEDHLWWPEGSPRRHMHGFGHYHETYERTDLGWQIATLKLSRLHALVDP
jgi:SnoaL-like protein